jgi:hypothetical protein
MANIKRDQVLEIKVHTFVTEASTIGLRPGEWPERIDTELGNGQPLLRGQPDLEDGEIRGVRYRQAHGCIAVLIVND